MDVEKKLYIGVVEENIDPRRQGRIKVRVQTLYHEMVTEDIPWASPFNTLAGRAYEVPAIGKLVNVMYFQNDLYDPYYIFSENYNINLQNKLKDLSDQEYIDFVALLFDDRTQIYADNQELTIDHLINKITINTDSINLELKDNMKTVNLGSKHGSQDAVLGTNFFDWMDKFIDELSKPSSLIGNKMAPVRKPNINRLCAEYKAKRKDFVSKHVKLVDNLDVTILERTPTTDTRRNDFDLIMEDTDENQKILNEKIQKQNDEACQKQKESKSTNDIPIEENEDSTIEFGSILPLEGERISSRFGLRLDPVTKQKISQHNGIDISAPIGTPIISPYEGIVTKASPDSSGAGGNMIMIDHKNGIISGYCHLSKILVKVGNKIKAKQIIGLVGNTGTHTTSSHLHFFLQYTQSSERFDPEKYFTWPSKTNDVVKVGSSDNSNYNGQNYTNKLEPCVDEPANVIESSSNTLDGEMDTLFMEVTRKVVEKLEGGYFHPDMLLDGRVKDKRYNKSGETMFGIDRKAGGKINDTPAGKKFWKIIDDANARKLWKWNYNGGDLKNELLPLVSEIMKPEFDKNARKYLSPKAVEIVNGDSQLLFHFIYATWNGPGWFKKFAKKLNEAIEKGITDIKKLRKIAITSRTESGNSLIAQGGNKINTLYQSNYV